MGRPKANKRSTIYDTEYMKNRKIITAQSSKGGREMMSFQVKLSLGTLSFYSRNS